jgi:uroporphyrinogen decarboxylase
MKVPERIDALLKGQPTDRIPFLSFTLGFCAKNVGIPVSTIYSDPEQSFQAQLKTQEQYGYDTTPFYGYASFGGAEFGGEITLPRGEYEQAPSHGKFPIYTEEDLDKLTLPDVTKAGFVPLAMEFSLLQKKHGVPISLVIGGPFTVAGNICPVDTLCRWLLKKPDVAERLIGVATDYLISVVNYWINTFGSGNVDVQIWEPLSSNQIISPKQFERFVFPYQQKLNKEILQGGLHSLLLHICGEQNRNLPYWSNIEIGECGIASIGHEVDITTAIKYLGDKCVIAGNIESSFIQIASSRELYELCRSAIEKGKRAPRGFIIMPSCEIPINTPPYNIYTMMKAVENFGKC